MEGANGEFFQKLKLQYLIHNFAFCLFRGNLSDVGCSKQEVSSLCALGVLYQLFPFRSFTLYQVIESVLFTLFGYWFLKYEAAESQLKA